LIKNPGSQLVYLKTTGVSTLHFVQRHTRDTEFWQKQVSTSLSLIKTPSFSAASSTRKMRRLFAVSIVQALRLSIWPFEGVLEKRLKRCGDPYPTEPQIWKVPKSMEVKPTMAYEESLGGGNEQVPAEQSAT